MNNKEPKIEENIPKSECIPIKKSQKQDGSSTKNKMDDDEEFTESECGFFPKSKSKIIKEIDSLEKQKKTYPPQQDFIQPSPEVSTIFQETFDKIFQAEFIERYGIFKTLKECENRIRALFFLQYNQENYIDYVVKYYGYSQENLLDMLGTIPNPLIHEILASPVLTLEEKCAKLKYVRI